MEYQLCLERYLDLSLFFHFLDFLPHVPAPSFTMNM